MEMEAATERVVQVRFTTKLPPQLRVVATPFSVPAKLTRYGLSDVVNSLLGFEKPQPFDFLVDGELVRTSLENLLLSKKISAETTLTIEYVPAIAPPDPQEPRVHDDWVSAVDGSFPSFLISGSYDSFARIWNSAGQCIFLLEGHRDAVTSLATVPPPGSKADQFKLVTASKDHSLHLWQVGEEESSTSTTTIRPVKLFKGHKASVQSISASPSGSEVCSGSWDATIKLWRLTGEPDVEDDSAYKKRKLNGMGAIEHSDLQVEATTTLDGHTQCVGAVVWAESQTIHSASWDHSLRSWDVETSVNTTTLTCSKALHCLSVGGVGSSLLAGGGADPVLRIWDPRIPGTVAPALQLSSHKSWISACKWHSSSIHHLLSASYDGTIKLWDTRSKVPLHTLQAHKDKVLSADWWKEDSIISGGADAQLQVFSNLRL
ncbi:unnamed protein product [Sphagnum balticum]